MRLRPRHLSASGLSARRHVVTRKRPSADTKNTNFLLIFAFSAFFAAKNRALKDFVCREAAFRVWRGCKPEGLKRRLGGGLGEA